MLELYKNIKKRREELGLSQDALAKKVGYTSRSTVARIEHGDIDIPQSMIMKFAHALKTTPGELMGWDEENFEYNIPTIDEEDLLLIERAGKLTDRNRKLLDVYVEMLMRMQEEEE